MPDGTRVPAPPAMIIASLVVPDTVPKIVHAQSILDTIAAVAGLDSIKLVVLNIANNCQCVVADNHTLRVRNGLFSIVGSEAELAAVLSHAVAQILLNHNRELSHRSRLERRVIRQPVSYALFGSALAMLVSSLPFGAHFNRPLGLALFLSGSALVAPIEYIDLLRDKNTRVKEDEADYVGMLLMTEAGYDPDAMVRFWKALMERRGRLHATLKKTQGAAMAGQLSTWADIRVWTPTRTADGLQKAALIRDYVIACRGGGDMPNHDSVTSELPFGLHAWTRFKADLGSRDMKMDKQFQMPHATFE